jgi:hypothetical protein
MKNSLEKNPVCLEKNPVKMEKNSVSIRHGEKIGTSSYHFFHLNSSKCHSPPSSRCIFPFPLIPRVVWLQKGMASLHLRLATYLLLISTDQAQKSRLEMFNLLILTPIEQQCLTEIRATMSGSGIINATAVVFNAGTFAYHQGPRSSLMPFRTIQFLKLKKSRRTRSFGLNHVNKCSSILSIWRSTDAGMGLDLDSSTLCTVLYLVTDFVF